MAGYLRLLVYVDKEVRGGLIEQDNEENKQTHKPLGLDLHVCPGSNSHYCVAGNAAATSNCGGK